MAVCLMRCEQPHSCDFRGICSPLTHTHTHSHRHTLPHKHHQTHTHTHTLSWSPLCGQYVRFHHTTAKHLSTHTHTLTQTHTTTQTSPDTHTHTHTFVFSSGWSVCTIPPNSTEEFVQND